MLRAILFDLDGTLLDIELADFLGRYFAALERAAAGRFPGIDVVSTISASTEAMMLPHPGLTNQEAFWKDFRQRTGSGLEEHADVFDAFYAEEFPSLIAGSKPFPGTRRVVEEAFALGLRVVVATNPIFPLAAVRHRLDWAGLGDLSFDAVTAYEQMHATKPSPAYYRETAEMIGVAPAECLMVGDDPVLDLAAADVGMRTFYVGPRGDVAADFHGDLDDLCGLLPRLAEPR